MGGIAVKNLRNTAQAGIVLKMFQELGKERAATAFGNGVESMDLEIRLNERPDQESPDRSLVIGGVALTLRTGAASFVTGV